MRLALLAGALLLAACSGKTNVREPAALQDIANPELRPQLVWTARTGADRYYGKLLLAAEPDAVFSADQKGRVWALNPQNGRRIWRVDTGARIISGPTVSGSTLLLGTLDGEVIALQRADGAELWRAQVSSEVMAAPVSDGSLVVVRTVDGRTHGLSITRGEMQWVFDRSVPNLTLRGLSSPLLHGGGIFVGMDNGRVAVLRPEDGQPIWEQVVAAPTGRTELERLTDIDADLIANGPELYVASFGGELACVDAQSGQVLWRRSIKSYTGMVFSGETVVVSDEQGHVWALDARSGAAAWKQEGLQYRGLSAPAVWGDAVVVGDAQGYLHWLNPSDGQIIARRRAGSAAIQSAPVAAGDWLYVRNRKGRISAIRLRE
ncbi:MAG: outer membrane protein assembly factor BamB [Gammaproteobacteria bacterium]